MDCCSVCTVCVPGTSVCQCACVACEFVDSTLVLFLCVVLWFLFRELLYCVCASKCDDYVCVPELVGQFSYPWAAVCEYTNHNYMSLTNYRMPSL